MQVVRHADLRILALILVCLLVAWKTPPGRGKGGSGGKGAMEIDESRCKYDAAWLGAAPPTSLSCHPKWSDALTCSR